MAKARSQQDDKALSVVVGVDDAFVASEAVQTKVLGEFARAGLEVVKVMRRIGIVTGRVPAEALARLRAIEHVVSVERDEARSSGA